MNALSRTAVVALALILMTLGVFTLRVLYSQSDSPENRRGEQLQKLERATRSHLEARRQAVHEWIAQRRTLAETLQRFQEWPDYSAMARKQWPVSDQERRYQHIRFQVELLQHGRPAELAPVLRRLEKDYRQLQAGKQTASAAATERSEQSR